MRETVREGFLFSDTKRAVYQNADMNANRHIHPQGISWMQLPVGSFGVTVSCVTLNFLLEVLTQRLI